MKWYAFRFACKPLEIVFGYQQIEAMILATAIRRLREHYPDAEILSITVEL